MVGVAQFKLNDKIVKGCSLNNIYCGNLFFHETLVYVDFMRCLTLNINKKKFITRTLYNAHE